VRAEYAEIQLLAPKPGEPVLRSISGQGGEALMHPESVAPADQLAFDRIAQVRRPLLLGRRRDTIRSTVPRASADWGTRSSARSAARSALSGS
jgi:hypothetical protein